MCMVACRAPGSGEPLAAASATSVATEMRIDAPPSSRRSDIPGPPAAAIASAFPAPDDVAAPPRSASTSASGVRAQTLEAGQGTRRPAADDLVTVRYTAWRRDGSLFQAPSGGDRTPSTSVRRLLPGIAEVVRTMVEGETKRAWVPARLAAPVGEEGPKVPDSDLTYDLQLLEITAAPAPPPNLTRPPRKATRLPSGVTLDVLVRGSGKEHPDATARVVLQYSAWTEGGMLFESTVLGGSPVTELMAELSPGLREGVSQMVAGEKARLWIPASLAFGEHPRRGAPAGPVVYDVELLDVHRGPGALDSHSPHPAGKPRDKSTPFPQVSSVPRP
jgi:FKBP-type peptidyl-prolyl cis-trans isomerase